jgi:hypothetical protein
VLRRGAIVKRHERLGVPAIVPEFPCLRVDRTALNLEERTLPGSENSARGERFTKHPRAPEEEAGKSKEALFLAPLKR